MLALFHAMNRKAKDDTSNEKQTLLPRRPNRRALCYRWVIALFLFSSSLCGSWLMYYSLKYCSTHGCMRGVEGQTNRGITVVPSLGLNIDWTHAALLGVYILVLAINFIYRGVQHVQWHIVSFAGFLLFQLTQATWTLVIHRDAFVVSQLEASWDNAYRHDPVTLDQLQSRWQCQGFANVHDRASSHVSFATPCQTKLVSTFGHAIYVWGAALWTLKIIQLMGLFACYIIYLHFEDESDEKNTDTDEEKSINYNTQPVNEK